MSNTSLAPVETIVVPSTPVASQVITGVKDFLLVGAAAATALGATHTGTFLGAMVVVAGPIAGLLTIVWGQLYTRKRSKALATMANILPDSVAHTA